MDLKKVLEVLDLMEKHGLDEIEIEEGGVKIRLRKGGLPIAASVIAAPPPNPGAPANSAASAPAAAAAAAQADMAQVVSPMVGTFYRAPTPDGEPFVSVGDHVTPDTVVCIIEAMKVMNEIKAEIEGEVLALLVESGESVEYGQPLLSIRSSRK